MEKGTTSGRGGGSVVVACRGGGGGAAHHGGWDACWVQAAAWLSSPRCGSHGEGESAEPRAQSPEPKRHRIAMSCLPTRVATGSSRAPLWLASLYCTVATVVQYKNRNGAAKRHGVRRIDAASHLVSFNALTLSLSLSLSHRGEAPLGRGRAATGDKSRDRP